MRTQTGLFSASTAGKKGRSKRDCRKRIRYQGSCQEALAENERPPGCEACEEEANSWILMLGLDSLRSDGNVEAHRKWRSTLGMPAIGTTTRLILSASVIWSNDTEIWRQNTQASTSRDNIGRRFPVCRPITAVRDLTAMCCEVGFSKNGACILIGGTL